MATDSRYEVLFEPIGIGPKLLPNRFWQTPHSTAAGSDYPGFQAAYRGMKAEGGWGAVFVEATSVAVEADTDPLTTVRLWDAGDIRNLRLTTEAIHAHGSLAGVELFYGGAPVNSGDSRHPSMVPTQMVTDANYRSAVVEMDVDDIQDVQDHYVAAALRARDAGFDLVTIQACHAISVISKFLLPMYNRRTDAYGGDLEHRARFARETLEAVRAAVGDDCAVGIRFGLDTLPGPYGLGPGGIRAEPDGHAFLSMMDDVVDYWDLNVAGLSNQGEDIAPSRTHGENHQQPYVHLAKQFTSKPVVNVGRFTSPDTMVQVIKDGQCDIVGGARPSISDPFLPKKIREGRLDEIRECIGCNLCISKFDQGSRIACTQNATVGEEFRRGWHPERFRPATNSDRAVLVVGAGPAGLECATVLAKRGMEAVHLIDADRQLGGCVTWMSQLPGLSAWRRLIDYRATQLEGSANVEAILGRRLSANDILEYGAEIVVIATGSRWADDGRCGNHMDPVPGADAALAHVLTPEQVMVEGKALGHAVTVFDTEGYVVGHTIAERLARRGHRVTLVTNHHVVSPYSQLTTESPRINRGIRELGVHVLTDHHLTAIAEGGVTLRASWTDKEVGLQTDSTVLVTQRYSVDPVYRELRQDHTRLADAGIVGLYRIGDCEAPNVLAEAVYSGHRLAREIDSPRPDRPLPFIRERRLLAATEDDYVLGSSSLEPVH